MNLDPVQFNFLVMLVGMVGGAFVGAQLERYWLGPRRERRAIIYGKHRRYCS